MRSTVWTLVLGLLAAGCLRSPLDSAAPSPATHDAVAPPAAAAGHPPQDEWLDARLLPVRDLLPREWARPVGRPAPAAMAAAPAGLVHKEDARRTDGAEPAAAAAEREVVAAAMARPGSGTGHPADTDGSAAEAPSGLPAAGREQAATTPAVPAPATATRAPASPSQVPTSLPARPDPSAFPSAPATTAPVTPGPPTAEPGGRRPFLRPAVMAPAERPDPPATSPASAGEAVSAPDSAAHRAVAAAQRTPPPSRPDPAPPAPAAALADPGAAPAEHEGEREVSDPAPGLVETVELAAAEEESATQSTRPAMPADARFQVQIMATSDPEQADEMRLQAEMVFPEEPVEVVWDPPNYKVRVGGKASMEAAGELKRRALRLGFTNAWVVPRRQS